MPSMCACLCLVSCMQHHDSIAGTAKQRVNNDYERILEGGRAGEARARAHSLLACLLRGFASRPCPREPGAYRSIAADIATATGYSASSAGGWALCPLANVTLCAALQAAQPTVAALYNSLGQAAAAAPVRLPVGMPPGVASWAVADGSGAAVLAQLVPLSPRDAALRDLYNGSAASLQVRRGTGERVGCCI